MRPVTGRISLPVNPMTTPAQTASLSAKDFCTLLVKLLSPQAESASSAVNSQPYPFQLPALDYLTLNAIPGDRMGGYEIKAHFVNSFSATLTYRSGSPVTLVLYAEGTDRVLARQDFITGWFPDQNQFAQCYNEAVNTPPGTSASSVLPTASHAPTRMVHRPFQPGTTPVPLPPSPLFGPMQNGRIADITTTLNNAVNLPSPALIRLLRAECSDGTLSLYEAMENGREHVVAAFLSGLVALLENQHYSARAPANLPRTELKALMTKGPDNTAALYAAMRNGHAKCANHMLQFIKILAQKNLMHSEEIAAQLEGKAANGDFALQAAVRNGHDSTVKSYLMALIQILPIPALSNERLFRLLESTDAAQIPALYTAVLNNHTNTVTVCMRGIVLIARKQFISQQQMMMLLAGVNAEGTPALVFAMRNGQPAAVTAYIQAIATMASSRLLGEMELVRLLAGFNAERTSALAAALSGGHTDSIMAFNEGIKTLTRASLLGEQQALELLTSTSTPHNNLWQVMLDSGYQPALQAYLFALAEAVERVNNQGNLSHYADQNNMTIISGPLSTAGAAPAALRTSTTVDVTVPHPPQYSELITLPVNQVIQNLKAFLSVSCTQTSPAADNYLLAFQNLFFRLDRHFRFTAGQLYELLQGQLPHGEPVLHFASRQGNCRSLYGLLNVVKELTSKGRLFQDQTFSLLAGQDAGATWTVYHTMQQGTPDLTETYLLTIANLAEQQCITELQLLMLTEGKSHDGMTALSAAMGSGRDAGVTIYLEMLALLAKQSPAIRNQLSRLTAGTNADGLSALAIALVSGHLPAIEAYIAGVKALRSESLLTTQQAQALLISDNTLNSRVWRVALQESHLRTTRGFLSALRTFFRGL